MSEVLAFLKNAGVYYIATADGDQPHVRPFSGIAEFEGKLYFPTNNQKKVYRQLMADPKFEICAMYEGKWIRIEGTAELDERREARVSLMEQLPDLANMYNVDDGLMVAFRIKKGHAKVEAFGAEPVEYDI